MMRRIVQTILIIALLGGSAVQCLSCNSLMEDTHPCCRALATIKKTAHPHGFKKASQMAFKGGSCGCAATPTTPQETPVGSGAIQANHTASILVDEPVAGHSFRSSFAQIVQVWTPNNYSPPHFILYHALLI